MEGFGKRLNQKINERGLNQRKVADFLGYKTAKSISDWVVERQTPPLPIIIKLAEFLNTTTDYLLLGKPERNYEQIESENNMLKETLSAYRAAEKAREELEKTKNIEAIPNKA